MPTSTKRPSRRIGKDEFLETFAPHNNWTRNSNRLLADLWPDKISGCVELALILLLQELTWGADPPKERAPLSCARIAKRLQCAESSVQAAIEHMEMGIAEPLKLGTKKNSPKLYRLRPDRWHTLPKYSPPKAPHEGEQPQFIDHAHGVVLSPGKTSEVSIHLDLQNQMPLDLKIGYSNQGDRQLYLAAEPGPGGLTFSVHKAPRANKQRKSSPVTSAPVNFSTFSSPFVDETPSQAVDPRKAFSPKQPPFRYAPGHEPKNDGAHEPAKDDKPLGLLLAEYRDFLQPLLLTEWGKALDEKFLDRIVRNTRRAPVEFLQRAVQRKFGKQYERASSHSHGLLIYIAINAGEDYEAFQAAERDRKPVPIRPEMSPEEFKAWFASLPPDVREELISRDPELSEEQRENR